MAKHVFAKLVNYIILTSIRVPEKSFLEKEKPTSKFNNISAVHMIFQVYFSQGDFSAPPFPNARYFLATRRIATRTYWNKSETASRLRLHVIR